MPKRARVWAGLPVSNGDRLMGGHPSKSRYSKDLQDGPQIMALGNGPKQDCWKILTLRPDGFVQFYLGTWLHKRGVYSSHMEGQWSHAAA